jgi:dienelactone hydrolase
VGSRCFGIFAACLALALLVSLSSVSAESPDDVALTWTHGKVVLPRSIAWIRTRDISDLPNDLAAPRSTPAIVYSHGSDGINDSTIELARALSEGGFAVFITDSYNRPGRVSNCDSKTHVCNRWPDTYRHRNEEIVYAARAIASIPFVDPKRVVLLGHSEGGIAAAHYAGGSFAGIVISGWNCGPLTVRERYLGDFGGIKSPPSVPILSIYSQRDPWYAAWGGLDGDCSRYFKDRAPSRAILEPGDLHYLLPRRDIVRAVIEFAQSATGATK